MTTVDALLGVPIPELRVIHQPLRMESIGYPTPTMPWHDRSWYVSVYDDDLIEFPLFSFSLSPSHCTLQVSHEIGHSVGAVSFALLSEHAADLLDLTSCLHCIFTDS